MPSSSVSAVSPRGLVRNSSSPAEAITVLHCREGFRYVKPQDSIVDSVYDKMLYHYSPFPSVVANKNASLGIIVSLTLVTEGGPAARANSMLFRRFRDIQCGVH